MDQWEACRYLADIVHENDSETSAYIIQNFINHVNDGETFDMALSMCKRGWSDLPDKVIEILEQQGEIK